MDIEEIAKLDLYLRAKNGLKQIMDIEALIVIENDQNAVSKLKNAAYTLSQTDNIASEEIKNTWANLFSKQVRFSVNRAKQKQKN